MSAALKALLRLYERLYSGSTTLRVLRAVDVADSREV
jgi:hypothetical protein